MIDPEDDPGQGSPSDHRSPSETFKVLPVTLLCAGIGEGSDDAGLPFGRMMVLTVAGEDGGTYPLALTLPEAIHCHRTIGDLLRREGTEGLRAG